MPPMREYAQVPASPASPMPRPPEEFDLDLEFDDPSNPSRDSSPPRRHTSARPRLAAIAALVLVAVLVIAAFARGHHQPYPGPPADTTPQGVDDGEQYMLDKIPVLPPFPIAEYEGPPRKPASHPSNPSKPWLAATMVSAKDVQRRALVRNTWLRYYQDVPFDHVFVLGNPVPESTKEEGWVELVQAENRTYGDLVVLDRVYEGARHANTYKTVEFFRWMALRPWMNRYAWVSKVDGDSFLDARKFYAKYIEPRIMSVDAPEADTAVALADERNDEVISREDAKKLGMGYLPTVKQTFIARTVENWGWKWAGGQFYTISRDLLALLPKLQDLGNNPHPNPDEDIRNAMILKSHSFDFDIVQLRNEEAFDFVDSDARDDGTAWARDNRLQGEWRHAVGREAINPHKMKTDAQWMKVAACYDEKGLKTPPKGL